MTHEEKINYVRLNTIKTTSCAITQKMLVEAKEIIRLHELQERKIAIIRALPELEEGMVLEYQDLGGDWFEYTKDLQENIHFDPMRTRVRIKETFFEEKMKEITLSKLFKVNKNFKQ
jgi:hypothetical protein